MESPPNLEQGRENLRPDREVLLDINRRSGDEEQSSESSQPAEFNLVQENAHDGDLHCCGLKFKGVVRVLYRNRLEYLIRIKAVAGFVEMLLAMVVMFVAPDNVCNVIRYWILAWVIRLPLEMPLLSERLHGIDEDNKCVWMCDAVWNVAWFCYGVYLASSGECYDQSIFIWCGLICILGVTILCGFLNWPFVALFVYHRLDNMKPILPHLPHYTFTEFKSKKKMIEDEGCVICMNNYQDENVVTELPCNHFFHQHCINIWLENHNTCPMCRAEVPDDGWSDNPAQPHFMTVEQQIEQEIALQQQIEYNLP